MVLVVPLLLGTLIECISGENYDGYSPFLETEIEEDQPAADHGLGEVAMAVNRDQGLQCPTSNVITTRYKCKVGSQDQKLDSNENPELFRAIHT